MDKRGVRSAACEEMRRLLSPCSDVDGKEGDRCGGAGRVLISEGI